MYKSPVELIYGQLQTQIEGDVMRAIQQVGVNVDKDELIRALQYDRGQYNKGYADGRNDALEDLVCCENCKNNGQRSIQDAMNWTPKINIGDSYCSYGERKDENK